MTCVAEQRAALRPLVSVFEANPLVVATTLVDPDPRPTWALEVVVEGDALPPALARTVASYSLYVEDVSQRGEPTHTVATLRP